MPKLDTRLVRAECIKGFMYMEHIDDGSCWFHGYMNVNPNLSFMPDSFFNFLIKRIIYKIIDKLQGKETFEKDVLNTRIVEKAAQYDILR